MECANEQPHSILDIAAVSVGEVLSPPSSDDDLLGEMLEDRSGLPARVTGSYKD